MRKFVNTVLAAALGLSMIAGVSAQRSETATGDAEISVILNDDGARSVEITQAPDFGVVPYSLTQIAVNGENAVDEEDVPTNTNLIIVATDDTGGTLGWNVTLAGLDFTTGGDTPLTFGVTALSLGGGPNLSVGDPGDATVTTTGIAVSTDAQKVMSAPAASSSNGEYTTTFTGNELRVPGGTLVGDYTSTLTVTIDAAP